MLNVQDTMRTALQFHQKGDLKTAEYFYRQVLKQDPAEPNANNLMGMVLHSRGRHNAALELLRKAVAGGPGVADFHKNLARIYTALGRTVEAIESLQRVVSLSAGDYDAYCMLGSNLAAAGRYEEAQNAYDTAIGLRPTDPTAVAAKAITFERTRRYEDAATLIEPFLKTEPVDIRIASVFGSFCSKLDRDEDAIRCLEGALANDKVPPRLREPALFNLAGLYDRRADHDKAFATYKAANEATPRQWDPAYFTGMVDKLIARYRPGELDQHVRTKIVSDAPVFIVGMPRSGTSLIEQIIDCHPRAFGAGELPAIRQIVVEMFHRVESDQPFPDYLDHVSVDLLSEFAEKHLRSLLAMAPGARRITDKSPGNFVNLGLIAQLYPKARIINCGRDPRDSCLSCYFKSFTFGLHFSKSLESLAYYYNDYRRLMAHWREALDLPILDLQYEDTVADTEGTVRRVIEFLGLEWDDACLQFHESDRQVNTASYEQVRKPIYASSVGRYKTYEQYLQPLIEILKQGDPSATAS